MRTSELKSAYVKKFVPSAILPDESGQLPKAAPIEKPREKREKDGSLRTTSYFYKFYPNNNDTKQYLATIEAVGASLLRLVFDSSFTPKVRVLEHPHDGTKPRALSKAIHFTSASKLSHATRVAMIATQQRGLAKLFTSVFCFEDPDVHACNWGLDENANIVKIDHDRMFCLFSKEFQGRLAIFDGEADIDLLMQWKNLAYKMEYFFGIISPDDILSLPLFVDSKPYNYPFRFKITPQAFNGKFSNQELTALERQAEITVRLSILSKDNEFIRWKFFYLTKYLLLTTPENVRKMVASHSIGSDTTDEQFCQHIMERHRRIKEVLLCMPEYQHYFNAIFKNQWPDFVDEIAKYNQEFRDKKTGKVKPHKKEFIIDLRAVETSLVALTKDFRRAASTNTPEKIAQREIELDIARVQREMFAIKNLTGVFFHETSKHNQATKLSQNPYFIKLPFLLAADEKKIIDYFLKSISDKQEVDDYFRKNPRGTYADFFNMLAQNSNMYLCELKRRLEESKLFVSLKIESLVTKHNRILSTQQLEHIWNSHEHCDMKDKVRILEQLIGNCPSESIPALLYQWMIQSSEQIESMRSTLRSEPQITPRITQGFFSHKLPANLPADTAELIHNLRNAHR